MTDLAPTESQAVDVDALLARLDPKERRFTELYVATLNPQQAAVEAGYSGTVAIGKSYGWVGSGRTKPHVYEAVQALLKTRNEALGYTSERFLDSLWKEHTADARELSEVRVHCCRCCWGADHRPMMTRLEHEEARDDYQRRCEKLLIAGVPEDKWPPFDERGGVGYDRRRSPNPECPECGGEGEPDVVLKDTRKISSGAARIYAGARKTKQGIEVRVRDRSPAMQRLASHLGIGKEEGGNTMNVQFVISGLD